MLPVVAIIGILKAGAAFALVEENYAPERIEYIRKNGIIPSRSNNEKISFCYLEDRAFFTIKNDE